LGGSRIPNASARRGQQVALAAAVCRPDISSKAGLQPVILPVCLKKKLRENGMDTPLQIDFQGMEPNPKLQASIGERVDELETRFGHIIAARAVLKGPGGHHRTGAPYELNIHLSLPGGHEVNISRTPHLDERHGDVTFAINDAFRRARRRLQDRARKIRGDVKHHDPAPAATVRNIDASGEFGFLDTDDGREIYFHRNSVVNGQMSDLEPGTRVTFAETVGNKGPQASTVKIGG
jgi:cold shock CspA family protein